MSLLFRFASNRLVPVLVPAQVPALMVLPVLPVLLVLLLVLFGCFLEKSGCL